MFSKKNGDQTRVSGTTAGLLETQNHRKWDLFDSKLKHKVSSEQK